MVMIMDFYSIFITYQRSTMFLHLIFYIHRFALLVRDLLNVDVIVLYSTNTFRSYDENIQWFIYVLWTASYFDRTILRDVPIMWRSGTKLLIPRELDQATNGRMYINSRDHLVITKIFYRDADLYR